MSHCVVLTKNNAILYRMFSIPHRFFRTVRSIVGMPAVPSGDHDSFSPKMQRPVCSVYALSVENNLSLHPQRNPLSPFPLGFFINTVSNEAVLVFRTETIHLRYEARRIVNRELITLHRLYRHV